MGEDRQSLLRLRLRNIQNSHFALRGLPKLYWFPVGASFRSLFNPLEYALASRTSQAKNPCWGFSIAKI